MKVICYKCRKGIEINPESFSDDIYQKKCENCATPFVFFVIKEEANKRGKHILHPHFQDNRYSIRRKFFKLFGGAFYIYNSTGELAFYIKQKSFKLKEDIRLYIDEGMSQELLLIKARQIVDFSAAYDVIDPMSGEKIGAFKRKGFRSLFRDEWIIMNKSDEEIGKIKEDSVTLALIRRFLLNLIPQSFIGMVGNNIVFQFKQRFNPIVFWMDLDFSQDVNNILDRRMGIAASILLCAIERRQR